MSETAPKLVVGLGNIGAQYEGTRHNTGFAVVDDLAQRYQATWHEKTKFKAHLADITIQGQRFILAKATTLYNLSGDAVAAISRFYKIAPERIAIIHDELDLPFGTIRTRFGGGDAGNNGIKSITGHLGSGYGRMRIGIANEHLPHTDAAAFVLSRYETTEAQKLPDIATAVIDFIAEHLATDEQFPNTSLFI